LKNYEIIRGGRIEYPKGKRLGLMGESCDRVGWEW